MVPIEEQTESITDEVVSPIKELTYDEVTEPVEKKVASYDLSEMDWAEYLTHFTYLVEGLKDYKEELTKNTPISIRRFAMFFTILNCVKQMRMKLRI